MKNAKRQIVAMMLILKIGDIERADSKNSIMGFASPSASTIYVGSSAECSCNVSGSSASSFRTRFGG